MNQNERSYQTKKALGNALAKKLRRFPLKKITVKELTDECNLNRKTFYYYFADVYELFGWLIYDGLQEANIFALLKTDPRAAILRCASLISETPYLVKCLSSPEGNAQMKSVISGEIYNAVRQMIICIEKEKSCTITDGYREFLVVVYASLIGESFVELARGKIQLSPEEFTAYLIKTLNAAISASIS